VEQYLRLARETDEKHALQGKSESGHSVDRTKFLGALVDARIARIFIAERDGSALSAAVVSNWPPVPYLIYSASSNEGYRVSASKALLWLVIRTLRLEGCTGFNLGGMSASAANVDSPDHGLYKFKAGYGATERVCISGRKVLQRARHVSLSTLRTLKQRLM